MQRVAAVDAMLEEVRRETILPTLPKTSPSFPQGLTR